MRENLESAMLAVAARQWWVLIVQGILGILFGVLAILYPNIALITLAYLFGFWAIVSGVTQVYEGFRVAEARGRSWPFAVGGVVSIAAGIIAAFAPGITALALIILLGAWFAVAGALEVYTAWRIREEVEGEWMLALIGILRLAIGVIILVLPIVGAIITVALVATWSIIAGISALALGWRLRQFRGGRAGSTGPQATPTGA